MTFKNYVLSRNAGDNPAGDFTKDYQKSNNQVDAKTWPELRNYLDEQGACDGAYPAAYEVWKQYLRNKKSGAVYDSTSVARAEKKRADQEAEQERLTQLHVRHVRLKINTNHNDENSIGRIVLGLVLEDYQTNLFNAPNGFPGISVRHENENYLVFIKNDNCTADPIVIPFKKVGRLVRKFYKQEINSKNFPELYKEVVNRTHYLECECNNLLRKAS